MHWADEIAEQLISKHPNVDVFTCACGISPSGVVTVSEVGLVTAVKAGTATVTATSSVNNANGQKTTASVTYTISEGPAYSLYWSENLTGFTNVAAALKMAEKLGYTIVDRMLGGVGTPLEKPREFSEIELSIIERIYIICINLLVEPWANVSPLEPRLQRIETNSQFAQIISPSEMSAIVTMNMRIGNIEGMINVCMPYDVLEPVIDKLNTKYWYSTIKGVDTSTNRELIEVAIAKARIPIKAELGRSTISVKDFVNIQKGDIIKLNTKINDELGVFVGNLKKYIKKK